MSLFLIEERQFYHNIQNADVLSKQQEVFASNHWNQLKTQISQNFESEFFPECNLKSFSALQEWSCFSCIELVRSMKDLFFVKSSRKGLKLSTRVKLLGPHQSFIKVDNGYSVPQLIRKVVNYHYTIKESPIRAHIDEDTREIQIFLPEYIKPDSRLIFNSLAKGQAREAQVFHKIISPHLKNIKNMLRKIFKNDHFINSQEAQCPRQKQEIQFVQKFVDISSTDLQVQMNKKIKCKEIRKLVNQQSRQVVVNTIQLPPFLNKITDSYIYSSIKDSSSKSEEMITELQSQFIEKQLQLPYQIVNKDKQILNNIYLKNENLKITKIEEGGFSNIYVAQVEYWHINAQKIFNNLAKYEKQLFTEQKLKKKTMVIKKQLAPDFSQKLDKMKGRIQHQIDILKIVKKQKPLFLPKYYLPKNKSNFFHQSLLIDYVQFKTLKQLMQQNGRTLSLSSKLVFMYSIAQSVRFLRDHQIVHLDLKPTNILMHHKMLVKLIDFGESYHPSVSDTNYTPGFTIPYSCPQLFKDVTFLTNSDVFSIGVIFYEMLFNKCPFNFFTRTTNLDGVMQGYQQKWFFCHEQSQTYGEQQVLKILANLISKCIAQIPQNRPSIDWVVFILRCLIDFVN